GQVKLRRSLFYDNMLQLQAAQGYLCLRLPQGKTHEIFRTAPIRLLKGKCALKDEKHYRIAHNPKLLNHEREGIQLMRKRFRNPVANLRQEFSECLPMLEIRSQRHGVHKVPRDVRKFRS